MFIKNVLYYTSFIVMSVGTEYYFLHKCRLHGHSQKSLTMISFVDLLTLAKGLNDSYVKGNLKIRLCWVLCRLYKQNPTFFRIVSLIRTQSKIYSVDFLTPEVGGANTHLSIPS